MQFIETNRRSAPGATPLHCCVVFGPRLGGIFLTAFQRSEVSMHFIPKLTRQRISELPEGTPIRIGARVVIFDGCSIEPNYKGEDETFVYYIDANGQRERHFEWLLLESGTEFIESELCEYCARFRHPTDIKQVAIRFWNRSEVRSFCSDKGCALLYQQTIRVPAARQGKPRRRIS